MPLKGFKRPFSKGPVTFPTIVVLGSKGESDVVSKVQFFVLIPNLVSHMGMGFSSSKIDIYSSYQGRQNLINKSSL